MLEIVERAAVRNRRDQRAELQRGHRNAFAEGAHLADAAELRRNLLFGIGAELLARNVIAGVFAESELVRVVADFFKSKLAAERFEVGVVGVRQRLGKIQARAPGDRNFGLTSIRPSLTAARATESLMVEQGCAPLESASF